MPIALMGLLMYFLKPRGVTVDDNPLLPLYEVFMAFWAIGFMVVSRLFTAAVCISYTLEYGVDYVSICNKMLAGFVN